MNCRVVKVLKEKSKITRLFFINFNKTILYNFIKVIVGYHQLKYS